MTEAWMLAPWHWLVLALLLLALEALGAGGFVLGAALAAGLMALLLWLLPELSWASQLILFAVAAVAFSVAYWRFFRGFNQRTEQPQLNDRAAQLVGRRITLAEPLPVGDSRLQLGDTLWRVRSEQAIAAGTAVTIHGSDGMVLLISAVE
ncbi:NfeD family protein [Ferrimonas senticii]|uniref:NfeD family protein n=1 Tax=Ferrimonas senticii TaxID=394566 RepID=UPI000403B0E5|nr:NfeD family protein [Ferrimonas senticii]